MRFAEQFWLWIVWLLPLLWLVMRAGDGRARVRLRRLLGTNAEQHLEGANPRLDQWRRFFMFAVFWLLVALARPQWGASEVTVTQRGSDIVVALDISNSMLAEDVLPNRMERAKAELGSFLRRMQDSRVGLVYFAGGAFVQCPLTLDYGTAEIFLKMAGPDMMSEQGTDIGAALEAARKLLAKGREGAPEGTFQAILLVTDGEDLEGEWEAAGRECQEDGIRVIPVGVGDEGGGLIPVQDRQGRPAGFMKDEDGNVVTTHLDLTSLEKLAAIGGGSTFRIGVDGLAGDRLFRELQRLGRRELEERRISAYQERFAIPLLLAIACLVVRMLLRPRGRARVVDYAPARRTSIAVLLFLIWGSLGTTPARAELIRPGAQQMAKGREAYRDGDFDAALAAFEAASVRAPDDPVVSLGLGETLFQLKRYDEALTEFERAQGMTDDAGLRAEALYNRGTAALAADDPAQAVEHLRQALELDPEQQDALFNLEGALRRLERQQEQQQQEQDQDQDQENQDQEKQENEQDNQQQDQQQEQQEQDQDQQQQDQHEQQEQQEEQQPQDEQQSQQPEESPAEEQSLDQEELTREQAMQILNALDRDEEELKRSVQQRIQGGKPRSGKKW